MSAPRCIVPGRTYLVTTRALHRVFAFRPSPVVNQLYAFLLAVSAEAFSVKVHGVTVMSNHVHLVVTDTLGLLPAMLQTLDALLARALNAYRKRTGSVFERNNVDIKWLCDDAAVVEALAYTAANPVAAGCVEHGRDWPGLRTHARDIGRKGNTVRRPDWLFLHGPSRSYRGDLPDEVELRLDLPPGVTAEGRGSFIHELERAIGEREARARQELAAAGRRFLGAARCRDQNPDREATSYEPHGPGTGPSPIMATDKATLDAAAEELEAFLDAYATAWPRWRAGDHTVVFPAGTWLLVRQHSARTTASPSGLPPPA